jgi:hypothetical protein
MNIDITDADLLAILAEGVKKATDVIARVTDYRGGPVTTEYLLTADIARELIEQNYQVKVECLNRNLVNGMTQNAAGVRKSLGSCRTDIVVWQDEIIPLAIIEIKIGVKTLKKIADDLEKITGTIDMLKSQYASRVVGASVFQIHVEGNDKRPDIAKLTAAIEKIEKKLEEALQGHEKTKPGFSFAMHPLQPADAGVIGRELEGELDQLSWGVHGHATRFYAVLIRSTKAVIIKSGFQGLKERSLE